MPVTVDILLRERQREGQEGQIALAEAYDRVRAANPQVTPEQFVQMLRIAGAERRLRARNGRRPIRPTRMPNIESETGALRRLAQTREASQGSPDAERARAMRRLREAEQRLQPPAERPPRVARLTPEERDRLSPNEQQSLLIQRQLEITGVPKVRSFEERQAIERVLAAMEMPRQIVRAIGDYLRPATQMERTQLMHERLRSRAAQTFAEAREQITAEPTQADVLRVRRGQLGPPAAAMDWETRAERVMRLLTTSPLAGEVNVPVVGRVLETLTSPVGLALWMTGPAAMTGFAVVEATGMEAVPFLPEEVRGPAAFGLGLLGAVAAHRVRLGRAGVLAPEETAYAFAENTSRRAERVAASLAKDDATRAFERSLTTRIKPSQVPARLAQEAKQVWNEIVRPSANWDDTGRGILVTRAARIEEGYLNVDLLERQFIDDFRRVGLDKWDGRVPGIALKPGAARSHESIRGYLGDIIRHSERYRLSKRQLKVLDKWQDQGRQQLENLRRKGVKIGEFAERYLPQAWRFPDQAARDRFVRQNIGGRQPMLGRRYFGDWDAGIAAGGTPETNVLKLMRGRWTEAEFLAADQEALAMMMREGLPARKGRRLGWQPIDVPRFRGRTLIIQEAGQKPRAIRIGARLFPPEMADTINRALRPVELPGIARAPMAVADIGRDLMLNLDLSIALQFGYRAFVQDPVAAIRRLSEWTPAVMTSEGYSRFLVENELWARRFVRGGGVLNRDMIEYTRSLDDLRPPLQVSQAPLLKQVNEFQFQRLMNVGKLTGFKHNVSVLNSVRSGVLKVPRLRRIPIAGRPAKWTDAQIDRAAAQHSMNVFPTLNHMEIGTIGLRRILERFSVLTPTFLRSHVGLIAKTPQAFLADPQGLLSAYFLAQFTAITTALVAGSSWVLSRQIPSFDPRDPDFMTTITPWGRISPAGQIRTYIRFLSNLPLDMKNGYYDRTWNFFRGRSGVIPSEMIQQSFGETFYGEPLETFKDRAIAFAKSRLPIVAQDIVESFVEGRTTPEMIEAGIAGGAGFTYWPNPVRESIAEAAKKHNLPEPDKMGPFHWDQLYSLEPELREQMDSEIATAARRNQPWAQLLLDERAARERRNSRLTNEDGTGLFQIAEGREMSEGFNRIQADYQAELRAIRRNPRYQDVLKRRQEAEPKTEEQRLLNRYSAIFVQHEDDSLPDALFDDLDRFWGSLSEGEQLLLERNLGLSLPPAGRQLQADRRSVSKSGWWKIDELLWEKHTTEQGRLQNTTFEQTWDAVADALRREGIEPTDTVIRREFQRRGWGDFLDERESARVRFRINHPEEEARMNRLGYLTTVRSEEAISIYQTMTGRKPKPAETGAFKFRNGRVIEDLGRWCASNSHAVCGLLR